MVALTYKDKGFGVVLLNKSDCEDKMKEILQGQSKLKRLGPVNSNDNTITIDSPVQKRLLDLIKADLMPKWIYDATRPTGSRRPVVVGVTRSLPRDGGMANEHGAPEAGQLLRAWTRGRRDTESRQ